MRTLVIRYRKLGDALMATPVLRALGERGEVYAVGERAFERVFTGISGVKGFVPLENGEPSRWELAMAGLRSRRFRPEAALVLRFTRRSGIVARLAGCRIRAGGVRPGLNGLSGLTVNAYDATWQGSHQVEKYYAVAEAALQDTLPRYATHYEASPAKDLLEGYVVVHLGNGGSNLTWPDASFVEAIRALRARGVPVATTGTDPSFPLSQAAADFDLVRRTDLDGLAGVHKGARVVIGLDGGGPRVAAAVGTSAVVLSIGYRWTPHQAAPWMSPGVVVEPEARCAQCRPFQCDKRGPTCMASLSPERVVEAAMGLIEK